MNVDLGCSSYARDPDWRRTVDAGIRFWPRVERIRHHHQGWPWDTTDLLRGIVEDALLFCQEAMKTPARATVRISPTQYHFACECGSLDTWLEQLVDWETTDDLHGELIRATHRIEPWGRRAVQLGLCDIFDPRLRYHSSTFNLERFCWMLDYSERALIGIRTLQGLWCQTYRQGWMQGPPFCLDDPDIRTDVVAAMALDCNRLPGLPFTETLVREFAPWGWERPLTIEWSDVDDITSAGVRDPHCLEHPENAYRWLQGEGERSRNG